LGRYDPKIIFRSNIRSNKSNQRACCNSVDLLKSQTCFKGSFRSLCNRKASTSSVRIFEKFDGKEFNKMVLILVERDLWIVVEGTKLKDMTDNN